MLKIVNKINHLPILEKSNNTVSLLQKIKKKRARFRGLRTLKHILKTRDGECSDYTTFFVSILRACGIPARHVVGRYLVRDSHKSWHVWAEFFIENVGWIPCDPYYYKLKKLLFGFEPDNFMILHRGINIKIPSHEILKTFPILQTYYYFFRYKKKRPIFHLKYIWKLTRIK